MQEVTCYHCRSVVEIEPDTEHCANCGEDLRGLLEPEQVSEYFCARANQLIAEHRDAEALAEVERGLSYYEMADLRLLAAIFSEQLGEYEQMRMHVAAIPVDDQYRHEAEWLLRAHQDRQRALREGAKSTRYGAESSEMAPGLAEILGIKEEELYQPNRGPLVWTAIAAVMIVLVLSATWFTTRQLSAIGGESFNWQEAIGIAQSSGDADTDDADSGSDMQPVVDVEATPMPQASDGDVVVLLPTPTPTGYAARNGEAGAIADSNARNVVILSASTFDLDRFFDSVDRGELTDLPIEARLQGDKLLLSGIVYMDEQRRTMVDLLEAVPGVDVVSTADLLLRPQSTYVVQEGDTLWSIVYDIYGNYDWVEELYRFNLDSATSPDDIKPGDVLKVPPLE